MDLRQKRTTTHGRRNRRCVSLQRQLQSVIFNIANKEREFVEKQLHCRNDKLLLLSVYLCLKAVGGLQEALCVHAIGKSHSLYMQRGNRKLGAAAKHALCNFLIGGLFADNCCRLQGITSDNIVFNLFDWSVIVRFTFQIPPHGQRAFRVRHGIETIARFLFL